MTDQNSPSLVTRDASEGGASLAITEQKTIARTDVGVVQTLERARAFLASAVEMTGPADFAMVKAQIVMAETYARELQLSKEIRDDAVELIRRAEYALGKAIRKGQEEGTVRTRGETGVHWDRWNGLQRETTSSTKPAATDFAPHHELAGPNGIRAMSDGVEPSQFEQAVTEAKAEGNLSRANVVRKVKNQQAPTTRDGRADVIESLAKQGYSSRQMPAKVGVTEESVRQIARDYGIEIPADKIVGRTRRIDWTNAVNQTVIDLENTAEFIENQLDLSTVDFAEADEWVSSLTNSLRVLNRFVKQIKEKTHV